MPKAPAPDFVHGADGLGNINAPPPAGKPIGMSAAEFIVATARKYPAEVTLIAVGRLTNLALALQDPQAPLAEIQRASRGQRPDGGAGFLELIALG